MQSFHHVSGVFFFVFVCFSHNCGACAEPESRDTSIHDICVLYVYIYDGHKIENHKILVCFLWASTKRERENEV